VLGYPAPEITKVSYADIKKDLAVVTPIRLKLEKEIATLRGALHEQKSILETIGVVKDSSVLVVERTKAEKELSAIDSFLSAKSAFDMSKGSFDAAIKHFDRTQEQISKIDSEMEILSTPIEAPREMYDALAALRDGRPEVQTLPMPAKPTFADLPSGTCYTCNQTITEKAVAAFNERRNMMMGEYEQACVKTTQDNIAGQQKIQEWKNKISDIESSIKKYVDRESERKLKFNEMNRQRTELANVRKPNIPVEPTTALDVSRRQELSSLVRDLSAKIQSSIDMENNKNVSRNRVVELEESIKKSQKQYSMHEAVESALKQVPNRELAMIKDQLEIPGYDLVILTKDDEPYGIEYGLRGTKFNFLSKGEKLNLNCRISKKLSSLLVKPNGDPKLSIFFIDDQELLSDKSVFDEIHGQRIITNVDSNAFKVVTIE
jgi:hypothetical protein